MERRKFLKGAGVAGVAAAGAAAGAFPTPAISQGMRELRMVTTWPKNFPGLGTGAQRLADRITAATDGRITVKLFAAGELVPPFESFDAVSEGTADLFHGAAYYWQGKSKGFNFFTAVPMGLTYTEMNAWLYHGGGHDLWVELGQEFNLMPFPAGSTGSQMGGWFRQEVNSVEDFNGLKFRMPGAGGEVLRQLGAAVVNLPGGEIFPALQSGAIDATEWVGPWNDLAFGFYRVASYYYYPGFHEPGSTLECTFNLDVWNSFSESDQALVAACCAAENDIMMAEFNARNGDALNTLINEHGVNLRQFNQDIFDAFAVASADVLADMAAESGMVDRIYTSYTEFKEKAMAWTALSDQSYADMRRIATDNI
ncbi:MAG: TRAP transporter substrate-binding protein [Kiloniellales bacterium]